ncbi:MAG: D-lyxose/D-mannose family sugar isomerase [Candidatus Bipolaricaulota bacterium]|jgi:hypothetical protein|nr:D-lyxose/D-mannose family sugar isomerase [Candidatus Bipolaricaulota bacterium]
MKRSQVNALIRDAIAFFEAHRFYLPPFALWTPADWATKGPEIQEVLDHELGWDVTDYGRGSFDTLGLLLFTLRNGSAADLKLGKGKLYAEKVMISRSGQVSPMHFHWAKTEDIIHRGGGRLILELYQADEDGALSQEDVSFNMDGVSRRAPAGHRVSLAPGESITLTPGLYHAFWAEDGAVLVGEVSTVNDDHRDNRFHDPMGRFPAIEEDEPPLHLLVGDYAAYVHPRPKGRASERCT